jgi:hypothetical protein
MFYMLIIVTSSICKLHCNTNLISNQIYTKQKIILTRVTVLSFAINSLHQVFVPNGGKTQLPGANATTLLPTLSTTPTPSVPSLAEDTSDAWIGDAIILIWISFAASLPGKAPALPNRIPLTAKPLKLRHSTRRTAVCDRLSIVCSPPLVEFPSVWRVTERVEHHCFCSCLRATTGFWQTENSVGLLRKRFQFPVCSCLLSPQVLVTHSDDPKNAAQSSRSCIMCMFSAFETRLPCSRLDSF